MCCLLILNAGPMLTYVQGGPQGQEEEDEPSTSSSTNLDQPSTSSSSPGHQPSTSVDSATVPSPDQLQPSTSSSGTGATPHTTTATVTSPVTERPSAGDTGDMCSPSIWSCFICSINFNVWCVCFKNKVNGTDKFWSIVHIGGGGAPQSICA